MTTQYSHTATIAVPAALTPDANHLACLLGESAADINTFTATSYTDGATEYAVAHAAVKAVFLAPTQTGELPPTPEHGEGIIDRDAAQRAFDSMAAPGGIRLGVDVDPHAQFTEWGLTPIESDEVI